MTPPFLMPPDQAAKQLHVLDGARGCSPGSAPFRARSSLGGFTLIELLAVIAVLVLLAALLLPTINSARDRAAASKSASNLRQIGTALLAYTADNNMVYPFWNANPAWGPLTPAWYIPLSNGSYGLKTHGPPDFVFDPVLYSPTSGKDGRGSWPRNNPDYGLNISVVSKDNMPTRVMQVTNPSQTILMAETGLAGNALSGDFRLLPGLNNFMNTGPRANATENSGFGWMAFRFPRPKGSVQDVTGGSAHALFCDGHVEAIRFNDPRVQTPEGRRKTFLPDY